MKTSTWLMSDFDAGECLLEQVGSPKIGVDAPADAPELASIPAAILRREAMIAYQHLGGPQYLMSEPQLLAKVLLKLLPAEITQEVKNDIQVTISWASESRLSYAKTEVIEADSVPWREPAPDNQTKVAVDRMIRDAAEATRPLEPPKG